LRGAALTTPGAPQIWKAVYRPTTDKMYIMHTDVTVRRRGRHAAQGARAEALHCSSAQQMYQLLDYYTAYHVNDTIIKTYENITGAPPSPPGTGGFLGLAPPPPPPNGTLYNRTYYNVSLPANNSATFMSVVAYYGHGANAVRSAPRYIFSEDKDLTGGTGMTTQLILVARFNAGKMAYLQWSELGCSGCGGPKDPQCMQVGPTGESLACATLPTNPDTSLKVVSCRDYYNKTVTSVDNTTNVTSTSSSTYSLCGSGVYTGFSGTDRYGKPLKTGGQIDLVRKYSVSRLSSRALSYAKLAQAYVKEQVPPVQVASGSVNSR
jgi:hypothetical protein